MKEFPFQILFFVDNTSALITSLRAITSRFILQEAIFPIDNITMKPIKNVEKIIEFEKDKNGDVLYIEHPKNLKIRIDQENYLKTWDRYTWYQWIKNIYNLSHNYPELRNVIGIYLKELDSIFERSINHMDYLLRTVHDLDINMISPYFFLYYELLYTNYPDMYQVDWNKMLRPHVDAMKFIFDQIINEDKKKQITLEIFECGKILSLHIQKIISNEDLLKEHVIKFQREIFSILNRYAFYIDTIDINFKAWFLSLSQFFLHCHPISFSLKKSIVKFNMILFLANKTDELQNSTKIKYFSWKNSSPKLIKANQLKYLQKVHPFIRNVHHDEIFS